LLTPDGGYILAVERGSYPYGTGSEDAWLIKTDSQGKETWNITLGEADRDEHAYSIYPTLDGGNILRGGRVLVDSHGTGRDNIWLAKLAPG
jgi:hypothetical protein